MLTQLGKFLRKLRIDNDELMKEMADSLGLASSTLSSIENGRRKPPKDFFERMLSVYALGSEQAAQLEMAIMQSQDEVSLEIKGLDEPDRELAVAFAKRFVGMSEEDKRRIKEILGVSMSE